MIRSSRLRIATLVTAVAAALLAGTLVAGPADAAPAKPAAAPAQAVSTSEAPAVTGVRDRTVRIPIRVGTDAAAHDINCYTTLGGPVAQGTVIVNVVVAAAAWCDYPVTDLVLNLTLYWNGNQWGSGLDLGTSAVAASASGPCLTGAFWGKLFLEITWPTGVVGPPTYTQYTGHINFSSSIDC